MLFRSYLESRGLDEPTAEKFHVGFAPAGWEALARHLETKKVPVELAERAGLIRRRENGSHFRWRRMEPAQMAFWGRRITSTRRFPVWLS